MALTEAEKTYVMNLKALYQATNVAAMAGAEYCAQALAMDAVAELNLTATQKAALNAKAKSLAAAVNSANTTLQQGVL